jgi:long-chain acyl-CoA synthetase
MTDRVWLKRYDPGVPATIDYPEIPVFAFLEDAANQHPERTCILFRGHKISYWQMKTLTDRLAAALQAIGVRKGQRVGLFLPNLPQFVLAYYAVLKAGGVVAAMNPAYKQRELAYQAGDAGVEVLIGLNSAYELFQAVRNQAAANGQNTLSTVILTQLEDAFDLPAWAVGASGAAQHELPLSIGNGDTWLGDLIAAQLVDARPTGIVSAQDVAIFQYSGGTTGVPKGAVALHRNLVANSLMFRHWLVGLEQGRETALLAIPLYHVYGMVVGMSVSILLGAGMVLIPDPRNLPELLASIDQHQVTFFPGVPTLYALINQNEDVRAGKYRLRSIRACISGSAPLLREVREQFESLTGAQLMEGYGLSEAPTATHCNPMYGEKRSGSIGLPLPDVDCQIVSLEDGHSVLPNGEIGELVLRSPQVMVGYHNRPEETADALRGGWLHTGDIARMDDDGYFYIVDRKKELIKVSGFQVWPREIEEVIASHPAVLECSVAGITDPIRGEAPKAWVVLRPGTQASEDEIRAWCEEALVYYKVPVEVEFREALPRTMVGKILRRELVREHNESKGRA